MRNLRCVGQNAPFSQRVESFGMVAFSISGMRAESADGRAFHFWVDT
jgi:hypothetical protein